jgi:hypothetical protein
VEPVSAPDDFSDVLIAAQARPKQTRWRRRVAEPSPRVSGSAALARGGRAARDLCRLSGRQKAARAIRLPGRPRGVRFPWGSVLALRYGSLAVPLDHAEGAVARLRHRRLRIECPRSTIPAVRAARRGEDRRSYSFRQLQPVTVPVHLSSPAPFQRRGCGLPLVFLTPRRAFTEPCRPLTFLLSFVGTPESVPAARCATRTHAPF